MDSPSTTAPVRQLQSSLASIKVTTDDLASLAGRLNTVARILSGQDAERPPSSPEEDGPHNLMDEADRRSMILDSVAGRLIAVTSLLENIVGAGSGAKGSTAQVEPASMTKASASSEGAAVIPVPTAREMLVELVNEMLTSKNVAFAVAKPKVKRPYSRKPAIAVAPAKRKAARR